MGYNYGKQFEEKVKRDWKKLPGSDITRIPDQVSMNKGTSRNICDFIAFGNRQLFYIECKSVHGNTINFSAIPQYDLLLEKTGIPYVHPCVIIWFNDHDKVMYVPVEEITKMKKDGKKSIHIDLLKTHEYNVIEVEAVKNRIFMVCDFSSLLELGE